MLDFEILDVFTRSALAGNQLAVFLDGASVPDHLLQKLAREIGFSETVFAYPPERGGHARVRIFTPAGELPFAGHPVLGSAALVGRRRDLSEVTLETGRGLVRVRIEAENRDLTSGWMSQPVPQVEPFADERLLPALGVSASELPIEVYDMGVRHVYVALPSPSAVARLRPDLGLVRELGLFGINCFAGSGRSWKTRMFAPAHRVPEDAATGSAAGPLALHLVRHGRLRVGETIEIEQGAEIGRPSQLLARVESAAGEIRSLEVGGSVVAVGCGSFRADL